MLENPNNEPNFKMNLQKIELTEKTLRKISASRTH